MGKVNISKIMDEYEEVGDITTLSNYKLKEVRKELRRQTKGLNREECYDVGGETNWDLTFHEDIMNEIKSITDIINNRKL